MQKEKRELELGDDQLQQIVGGRRAYQHSIHPPVCGTDTDPEDPNNREIEGDFRTFDRKLGYRSPS